MTILVHAAVRCRMQECVEVPNAPTSWVEGMLEWRGDESPASAQSSGEIAPVQ